MQFDNTSSPVAFDLVLIGCGHAHVHVLKMLAMDYQGPSYLRVTVVSNTRHTPYSGMLPGYLAGHYTYADIHLDVGRLARLAGARLVHAAACGVTYNNASASTGGGTIALSDGRPPLRYDCLSIDIGSAPSAIQQGGVEIKNNGDVSEKISSETTGADSDVPPNGVIPVKPIASFTQYYHEHGEPVSRSLSSNEWYAFK